MWSLHRSCFTVSGPKGTYKNVSLRSNFHFPECNLYFKRADWVITHMIKAPYLFGLSKERPILDHHAKAHILDFMKSMKSGGFQVKSTQNLIKSDVSAKTLQFGGGGCMEGAMTPDFMKSKVIAPLLHSSNWIVFVETSEFIRFWVDFTWFHPRFHEIQGHSPSPAFIKLNSFCWNIWIYKVLGGFHLKSAGFHVKSKDLLQGIVTLCFNFFSDCK